jgi:hypothetical protein
LSPLRRIITIAALVLAAMSVGASCSAQQVQAYFSLSGRDITTAQASQIADYLAIWDAQNRALLQYLAAVQASEVPNEAAWDRVAACESGGNWSINTGNGYYGGLQFSLGTWQAYGGTGNPAQNSKAQQIRIAENVRTQSGLGHWPVCGSRF